jgi:hypothetical protein
VRVESFSGSLIGWFLEFRCWIRTGHRDCRILWWEGIDRYFQPSHMCCLDCGKLFKCST